VASLVADDTACTGIVFGVCIPGDVITFSWSAAGDGSIDVTGATGSVRFSLANFQGGTVTPAFGAGTFLYIAKDRKRATAQIAQRRSALAPASMKPARAALRIEVLLAVIHGAKVRIDASVVTAYLVSRGVAVTVAEVESILDGHGIKKTAFSRSRRSRR
jgi:hypothetical protein